MPYLTSGPSYLIPPRGPVSFMGPRSSDLLLALCAKSPVNSLNHLARGGQLDLNIMLSDWWAEGINMVHYNCLLFNNHYMLYFIH